MNQTLPTCQRWPLLPHLLASFTLAIVAALLICWNPLGAPPQMACFHVSLVASSGGVARLDTDIDGFGLGMRLPISAEVQGNMQVNHLRFDFAAGQVCSLLFTPLDQPGAVEIRRCWLATSSGQLIAEIPLDALSPGEGDDSELNSDGALRLKSRASGVLKPLTFQPGKPIDVAITPPPSRGRIVAVLIVSWLGFLALSLVLDRETVSRLGQAARGWAIARPRRAILAAALVSTGICTYPVVFCGKSFISPENGVRLLYDRFPTVPGTQAGHLENPAGSDIHATMYWSLPATVMEHRAIFHDGEFPLWGRYGWTGFSFLGQGITMLGDPLQWGVLLNGSAAWAWDAKFVIARLLFAFGIGWLVYRTSNSLSAALLLAASAPFIGFFAYRFCHVANFSLCYSPWMLVAWVEGVRARTTQRAALWSGVLILANWWELNSGTAKESSALIFFLNASGGLMMLLARESWRWRLARLAIYGWASILFLLLSAPFWAVFLDALGKSWTIYDAPKVYQLQPGLFVGLFDDIFLRQFVPMEYLFSPSANIFILLGIGWATVRVRSLVREPLFLASLLATLIAGALVFGVVSPALLAKIPMLRNITHYDNTFSCVLFILLFVVAGFGFREAIARLNRMEWRGDWLLVMTFVAVLLAAYFGLTQASHRVGRSFLAVGESLPKSAFFMSYVPALIGALALLPWTGRQALLKRTAAPAWALASLCLFAVLHFRHGMYLPTKFDLYTMNPQQRMDLRTIDSPALNRVREEVAREPARVLGTGFVMSPGFGEIHGLETPSCADPLMSQRILALVNALGIPRVDGWHVVVHHDRYAALRKSLDMLNVRYLLSNPDQPELPGTRRLGQFDLVVEESETAWPRAFFTDVVGTYSDVVELGRMVKEGDGRPFAALPVPARAHLPVPLRSDLRQRTMVPGKNYRLTSNTTSFEVDAPSPGLAVCLETDIPGDVVVFVDGQPAECITVSHAFRGVVIDKPGRHSVQFRYWPAVLEPAIGLSGVGIVGLLLSAWILARSRRRPAGTPPATTPEERLASSSS